MPHPVKKWGDFAENAQGRIMFQQRSTSRGQEIRVLAGSICFRGVYDLNEADEKKEYDRVQTWLLDTGAMEVEGWVDAEAFFLG